VFKHELSHTTTAIVVFQHVIKLTREATMDREASATPFFIIQHKEEVWNANVIKMSACTAQLAG